MRMSAVRLRTVAPISLPLPLIHQNLPWNRASFPLTDRPGHQQINVRFSPIFLMGPTHHVFPWGNFGPFRGYGRCWGNGVFSFIDIFREDLIFKLRIEYKSSAGQGLGNPHWDFEISVLLNKKILGLRDRL